MLVIKFEGVFLEYPGGIAALRGLTLEIRPGGCTALVGASGSGKTTALRLINRLLEPTAGRVLVRDRDASTCDPIALRLGIGYVIQGGGILPHMTVAENVGLVPRLLGWDAARTRAAVERVLNTVRLPHELFADRYPGSLSGGQRQRVGVARALAADPDIVLMDEPFGALDNVLREEMQDEFRAVFREFGKTVVLVTHDMHEAVHLADRIAVLQEGRLLQEGSPQDIVLRPTDPFVEALLGRRRADLERFAREDA